MRRHDERRPLLPVQRIAPAYEQVANQLRDLILQGELAPGQRLPSETELASTFGVSRTTGREALRILSSLHLVTTSRGARGGTFVARPEIGRVAELLEASIGLLSGADVVSVDELLEARELLEVPAVRLAASRVGDSDLEALRAIVADELLETEGTPDFEKHRRFHQAILRASRNRLLEIVTEPLFNVLRTRFLREHAPRAFWRRVAEDHRSVYERIEARDAEGAAEEMRRHLANLAGTYRRIDRMARRPRP